MDNLNDEIRALQNNILEYETQLTNLLGKGNEGMNIEIKLAMIKHYGDRISEINNQILEKEKLIAAKEIEKQKRITADKARGETFSSPTTFLCCVRSLLNLSTVCL